MNNRLLSSRSSDSGSSASGFVLVTVLIVMVLLVVLVVAFLMRVATERTSASGFHGSASARQLADMAVGLVQGQIDLATSQGSTNAWVSQPGMVRTYDQTGNLINAYKLYSSTNMIVSGSAGLGIVGGASPDAPASTWATDVAFWTDLNAPVQNASGTNVYPIVNPNATNAASGVSGFSVTSAPGATSNQPIPMPVRWLYVLQDGSLVAPTGSGTTATVAGETASNQIVGRIAFWTDDDTCRVNINTASLGTFWDVPRAYSTNATGIPISGSVTQEQALGYYQPVQKEFQRYPGHPAMTDLRAVFGTALTTNQIFNLVPRVVEGGSTQGTIQVAASSTLTGYPKNNRLYADVDELLFTPSRGINSGLSTSQLETAKFFLTAQSRAPEVNLFGYPRVACWPVNADYNPVSSPTSPYTTAFDRLIAFCSTVGNASEASAYYPYYFQRQNALSATNDISIARNKLVYNYLQYLTKQTIPGFGGNFYSKYPSPGGGLPADCDQILTEIFDYIRSTNLYDTTLNPVPDTSPTSAGKYQFTGTGVTGLVANGYVVPTVVSPAINGEGTSSTMGFGRSYTLSKLGIGFICNADGNIASSNYTPSTVITGQSVNRVLGSTPLPANQKYVQAILIPEFFSVMYGFVSMWPNMQISVSGLSSLTITGANGAQQSLFPNNTEPTTSDGPFSYHDLRPDGRSATVGAGPWGTVANIYGAFPGWRYFSMGQTLNNLTSPGSGRASPARGNLLADGAYEPYPLIGTPVIVSDPDTGSPSGTMVFSGGNVTVTISDHLGNVVQTVNINLPAATFPTPKLVAQGTVVNGAYAATTAQQWWAFSRTGAVSGQEGRLSFVGQPPTARSSLTAVSPSLVPVSANPSVDYYSGIFLRPDFDVLRTVAPTHGDYRLIAGMNVVPNTVFQPNRYYSNSTQMFASTFTNSTDTLYDPGYDNGGQYISTVASTSGHEPDIPVAAATANPVLTPTATEDYDNPLPDIFPGPFVNKPNEGSDDVASLGTASIPYYASNLLTSSNGQGVDVVSDGGAFFSPNRMMPSPGMFGSLPTGVMAGTPWQTLLFRPQAGHYGATSPPDHLLLDLFWMPVVEPYAISDRFSTAGKINMNYQILPFTYMKRETGLYALFQSERVTAIPNTESTTYKVPIAFGGGTKAILRDQIDAAQTLTQFDTKFSTGDVFKSASEICTLEIVPDGGATGATTGQNTVAGMPAYWASHVLTGDNVRERIYTNLYPRLTTKSNTYTVYFQAQALKKTVSSPFGTWTEGTDVVLGEYRGSAKIERFINANNTSIPDYATDVSTGAIASDPTLDTFYRWRTISNRQLAP